MDLDWISSDSKFSSLSNFVVALAFAIFDEQRYIYIYIYTCQRNLFETTREVGGGI